MAQTTQAAMPHAATDERDHQGSTALFSWWSATVPLGGALAALTIAALRHPLHLKTGLQDALSVATACGSLVAIAVVFLLYRRSQRLVSRLEPRQAELGRIRAQLLTQTRDWTRGRHAPLRSALRSDVMVVHPAVLVDGVRITLDERHENWASLLDVVDGPAAVIGDAGSGKSLLLWRLADQLLELVDHPASGEEPVPVVLELHRWKPRDPRESITEFAVRELAARAGLEGRGEALLEGWIDTGRIRLLLDGLDEVGDDRAIQRCAQEIQRHLAHVESMGGKPRLVLTCREAELEGVRDYLRGLTSLRLLELDDAQLDALLARADDQLPGFRRAVTSAGGATLKRLLRVPLWWTLVHSAYRDRPAAEIPTDDDVAVLQRKILEGYVQAKLSPLHERHPSMRRRLSFLASAMLARGDHLLYLHELQPNWLPARSLRLAARIVSGAALGLLFAGASSVVYRLLGWGGDHQALISAASAAGVSLVFAGSSYVAQWRSYFSWPEARRRLPATTWLAILSVLLVGQVASLVSGSVAAGARFGLLAGVLAFVCSFVEDGLRSEPAARSDSFGELTILRNSAKVGLAGVVAGITIGGALGAVAAGMRGGFAGAVTGGLLGLLVHGLPNGLGAYLQCRCTGWILAASFRMPWLLRRFLNRSIDQAQIMYRSGSGYRFLHRTLQEHLARGVAGTDARGRSRSASGEAASRGANEERPTASAASSLESR
jgi:NACHT domain-containing protein